MCVRPHGTTGLPLDGFSSNLILRVFFQKSVEKIHVSSKSDKSNVCRVHSERRRRGRGRIRRGRIRRRRGRRRGGGGRRGRDEEEEEE